MAETTKAPRIALFDLDHTLIPIDSDYSWGEFTTARGWTDPVEFKRRNDAFYAQYKAGTLDVYEYARFATQAIVAQGATNSIAAHADFMSAVVQKAIQPQALKLVQDHQAAGDTVIIVTATNAFVTRPIADAFGVQE
ncbi:MAG: HAD family hydrolase, partial [Rhodoferax sp.]